MKVNVDVFDKNDWVEQLAKNSGKVVMHLRADGVLNCDDAEKIEEVWDFYYGKCDNEVYNMLKQFGEIFCYFMTNEQAINALEDWFPRKSQLLDGEEHFYIYANVISPDMQLVMSNE
jgi:hypothetical protein